MRNPVEKVIVLKGNLKEKPRPITPEPEPEPELTEEERQAKMVGTDM